MTNPNSLANLIPFQEGQSGNPGGRPKESITYWMEEFLKLPIEELLKLNADENAHKKMTAKQAIAFKQVTGAITGKDLPTDRILDRTEGKAKQVVELVGSDILEEHRRMLAEITGESNAGKS